jgi:hypothetical protein
MRNTTSLALTLLAIVILAFGYHYWVDSQHVKPEIKKGPPNVRAVPPPKKRTNTGSASEVSEAEWNEVVKLASGATSPQSFKVEKLVRPGEKIVTQAYEGRPGEFVITEMTPIVRNINGKDTLFVSIASLSITPSSANTITATEIELPPKTTYARVTRINDAKYDVTIKGQIEGDKVRIKASGDYEKRPPMK